MLGWFIGVRYNRLYFNSWVGFVCFDKVVELGEIGVCGDEVFLDKRGYFVL